MSMSGRNLLEKPLIEYVFCPDFHRICHVLHILQELDKAVLIYFSAIISCIKQSSFGLRLAEVLPFCPYLVLNLLLFQRPSSIS